MDKQPPLPEFAGIQPLADFLAAPERSEGSFTLHELQGYLFAVACAPETVIAGEWLYAVFDNLGIEFNDSDESVQLAGMLVGLYNQIFDWIDERLLEDQLPLPVEIRQPALANLEPDAPLHQWSLGFLAGHESLAELWDIDVPELQDQLDGMLVGPLFFSSRTAAEALFKESSLGSFEELAASVLAVMQQAMLGYARLGLGISDLLAEMDEEISEPVRSVKIGRNEPCPCGSGKKYKKCCLNAGLD
jgi:uncharacterized protein